MSDHDRNTTDPRFNVRADRRYIRANGRSSRFLLVEVTAPTVAPDPSRRRPPVNLGFVLDRSGSMGAHAKLPLAKQAVDEGLARLDPEDRFALVAYDDRIDVVTPATKASPEARRGAADALRHIEARGSTNLGGGWLAGSEQVATDLNEAGVNRVLLLTDGLANVGMTDPAELEHHAAELRARGVTTSTFGVGNDFDERLLQAMADAGGGHFYYIGSMTQIRDHITSEVGETLDVVARDVVIEVTAPESVHVESLSPFPVEQRGSRTLVRLGDMVSGQVLTIVLRLKFDYGEIGREVGALLRVADREDVFRHADPAFERVALAWTYADHAENERQARDRDVDRAVARIYAARAKQDAVRLNREGRFAEAGEALEVVRQRISGYAGSDPELRAIAHELREEAPQYLKAMLEVDRKQQYFASYAMQKSRSPEGRSVRRPPEA
jgi:Ca-activated chloride channel homolog